MNPESLKSGKCPKCGSDDVYSENPYAKTSERMIMAVSGFNRVYFDIYLCTNCGFFEEYISENDIKNEKTIEKIKKNWKKVK